MVDSFPKKGDSDVFGCAVEDMMESNSWSFTTLTLTPLCWSFRQKNLYVEVEFVP